MRVIHIIGNLTMGGAEMMLYKLLQTMNRERFESVVISLMDEGRFGEPLKKAGFSVHTLDMKAGKDSVKAIWRLRHLIRSINPALIQGWMYHGNIVTSITRLFIGKKVPIIWNIRHALYDLQHEKKSTAQIIKIGTMLSKRTAKIIYNSRISAQQHEAFGYGANKTVIIPNGFDTQEFQPSQTARAKLRNTLQVPENTFLIGLIARYHPVKDHANFFQAAGQLAKANVHFVLAGRNVELNNPVIAKFVQEQKLTGRVHLLGERRDISHLTAGLDIASSSSYTESFPNTVGEAMACGVPCVVTDVGDSAWMVGKTGKVVPPYDSEALAEAWNALIKMGTEQRKQLGEAARKRVMDNFSLTSITRQYEQLYEQTSLSS